MLSSQDLAELTSFLAYRIINGNHVSTIIRRMCLLNCTLRAAQQEDSPSAQQRTTQRSWGDSAKSSLLWLSVLTSLLVVAAGICLLGFVITARSFAPSVSQLTKELYFDYSENTAVASASFREDAVVKVMKVQLSLRSVEFQLPGRHTCELGALVKGGTTSQEAHSCLYSVKETQRFYNLQTFLCSRQRTAKLVFFLPGSR